MTYKTMKIYYHNTEGRILWSPSYDYDFEPNLDRDYEEVRELNQYEKSIISLLVLKDGQYSQDFAEGRLIGVDLETKIPIFEYPNPEDTLEPIVSQRPLSEEIKLLESALMETTVALAHEQQRNIQNEQALIETTILLAEEQQKNAQNEQAIMELSLLVAGGNA